MCSSDLVWGEQLLVNSESVRPGEPSFALAGELTGPNPDGSIGVRFRLRDPDVYTVPDLATFLGDPGLAAARYEATVRRTRGARCRILYERGGSTLICGWRRRALEERIVGDTVRQRVYTSTDLRLELSPRGRPDPEYVGLPADLLPGPLTCTWTEHGRTVPCVVSDLRTTFRRR